MKKKLLLGVGVVALLGGGAAGYFFLAGGKAAEDAADQQAEGQGAVHRLAAATAGDGIAPDVPIVVFAFERKFITPLIQGSRVRSLLIADVKLELLEGSETEVDNLEYRLRDGFIEAFYAMAAEGLFADDLYSGNVQDRLKERLRQAASNVLGENNVRTVLIADLFKQNQ